MIRVHANVLGEEAELGRPGEKLLTRLLERAREQLGSKAPVDRLLEQASHGLVFVDEVDKIRSHVGGQPNVAGIRAQEALLTLIENEAVPFALPPWAGSGTVNVDSSGLLFVCAGAFEGLYDAVYDRVTIGKDQGALRPVTVVDEAGRAHEELQFSLRDWLKTEDLFEYGVSPQFLSRFDAVVLLEALDEEALLRILSDLDRLAAAAVAGLLRELRLPARGDAGGGSPHRPRGGAPAAARRARAEGDRCAGSSRRSSSIPAAPRRRRAVRVDEPAVVAALQRGRDSQGTAGPAAGWDQSFRA